MVLKPNFLAFKNFAYKYIKKQFSGFRYSKTKSIFSYLKNWTFAELTNSEWSFLHVKNRFKKNTKVSYKLV